MYERITVRMYHVGFGDCFLLRFWKGVTPFKILVDCGSITEGNAQVFHVVQDVITQCTEEDDVARIGLVVATHRHKDHVGGFSSPHWANVEVGEVWMPWTEDPDDKDATRIRNRQSALAMALVGGLSEDEPLAAKPPRREGQAASELRAQRSMAINALTNETAMATVHQGFAGDPPRHFLPEPGTSAQLRRLAGAPDLKIHVLGPPRTEDAIKAMDPPSGAGYLWAAPAHAAPVPEAIPAFAKRWQITSETFSREARPDSFREDDRKGIESMAEQPFGALAAALDKAVNNTSLILMFETGDAMLLFPGDAQWGAWDAMMSDPKARALLARTTCYKVGHHGSHNATPREFIESIMPPGGTALFSTHAVTQWPDIPRPDLVAAVTTKAARLARTDKEQDAQEAGFAVDPGLYIEWEVALS